MHGFILEIAPDSCFERGTSCRIVGALGRGSRVQVLRCEMQGRSPWYEIEMQTDIRGRSWVNARYLPGGD